MTDDDHVPVRVKLTLTRGVLRWLDDVARSAHRSRSGQLQHLLELAQRRAGKTEAEK